MKQYIAQFALVVKDYDEAIKFYTEKLSFTLIEDTTVSETKRWVRIAPPGSLTGGKENCCILLAKAATDEQRSCIGNQTGGRVFLFLHTDDFYRDYNKMLDAGIEFIREPSVEDYGIVTVFRDLYGNLWDFIGPTK